MYRDAKRMQKKGYNRELFSKLINKLKKDINLPTSYRAHKLKGKWTGYWECHVAFDWLLIYKIEDNEIVLYRTGTHQDLFG